MARGEVSDGSNPRCRNTPPGSPTARIGNVSPWWWHSISASLNEWRGIIQQHQATPPRALKPIHPVSRCDSAPRISTAVGLPRIPEGSLNSTKWELGVFFLSRSPFASAREEMSSLADQTSSARTGGYALKRVRLR